METKITTAADVNGDIPGGLADEYGIVILPQYYRILTGMTQCMGTNRI